MRLNRRRSGRRFIIIPLIVLAVLSVGAASGLGAYKYLQSQQEAPAATESNSGKESTTSLSGSQSEPILLNTEPKDISTKAEVGSLESNEPRISSISAIQDADPKSPTFNKVLIRATVQGAEEGTCKLKLTRKGQTTLIADVPLAKQPNYNICQGFDVAIKEFPTGGTWNIEVKADIKGTETAPATITIQVAK